MTTPFVIDRFEDLIEIGTTFGQNWYRGHSRIIGELTPGIFRRPYIDGLHSLLNPNPEFRYAINFKREAPSITSDLPDYENHLEWLFLMQHHGVPTRLLDWSENILIATFFSVISQKEDAEIWSIFPWKLNQEYDIYGLPLLNNPKLQFLAHEIFHTAPEELAKIYNLVDIPKKPMALLPALKHPRIIGQQSCFTIHPKPISGFTIPDIITDPKYLTRYIIPKALKNEFLRKLVNLGINHRTIFADLEGLAKSLKYNETLLGWSQPEPLKFRKDEE